MGTCSKASLKAGTFFTSLARPQRFKDQAKFNHCLELLELVATDEQREQLKTDLDMTSLEGVGQAMAASCLEMLNALQVELGEKAAPRAGRGYAGVGKRVQLVRSLYKKRCGDPSLKNRGQKPNMAGEAKGQETHQPTGLEKGQTTILEYPQKPRPKYHQLGPNKKRRD